MKPQTENALRSLLAIDDELSTSNIEKAIAYLRGERTDDQLVHVIKYKDVLSLLHCHRRTLEYYIAKGYLTRVYGGGTRAIGISRDSYIRFTTLRIATQVESRESNAHFEH